MAVNNMLYNNSLLKNTKHVEDKYDNHWFHKGIGNYWDDYKEHHPNATDENNDGIWDTPYLIYEETETKDKYPLVHPVTLPIKRFTL
jgi:nitrous oxidase accessory protein NosD